MLSLLLATSVAWPCAGLFTSTSEIASSDAQEVVLRLADGSTEVEYNVRYSGDATDLGWIIPIAGEFEDLAEADSSLFDEYRSLTAPLYSVYGDGSDGGCSCAGADKAGGSNELRADDFSVELASGYAGAYEYTVLDGKNTAAVLAWLDDNGWDPAGQSEAIQIYGLYDMDFVAVKLTPDDRVTGAEGTGLQPIKITYSGETLTFPAIMSYYGMLDSYRTTIWIEGEGRAALEEEGDWTEIEFGSRPSVEPDLEATAQFDDMLYDMAGMDRVYATTWAGESANGTFVTRFDTHAAREAHDADPYWVMTTSTDETHAEITVGEAETGSAAAVVGLLPLLGIGWARRRRRDELA